MSRVQPPVRLHSSEFLRFLVEKGLADGYAADGDIGSRLGGLLNVQQAIALQGIVGSADAPDKLKPMAAPRIDRVVLRHRFEQVRHALTESIMTGASPAPGMPRIDLPDSDLRSSNDPEHAFNPWRRYLKSHQRQMETVLRGLRQQLRGMHETAGKSHQMLARLDALFENVLLERESRLMAQLVTGFEKRFKQAFRASRSAQEQSAQNKSSAPWGQDSMPSLIEDLRTALLVELDFRLQPVLGLIEALTQDTPLEQ